MLTFNQEERQIEQEHDSYVVSSIIPALGIMF